MDGRCAEGQSPECLAIVRRGEVEVFRTLKEQLEEPSVLEVIWDRRLGERRSASRAPSVDRRRHDRRVGTPAMWRTIGFIVVRSDGGTCPGGHDR